jgi:small subunit ribosomal protein S16
MAVKIRLTRLGKKKQPTYRVVVMDSRKPRDGEYIEQLGIYDPRQEPSLVSIDNERALYWLETGAQPTERAQKLLEISGAWTQFRIAKGDIHTVATPEPEPKAETPVQKAEIEPEDEVVDAPESSTEGADAETTGEAEVVVEDATDDDGEES